MQNHITRPTFIELPYRAKDITGQRFGMLVALGPVGKQRTYIKWLCRCDCGNVLAIISGNLLSGGSRTCGCVGRERIGNLNKTHGLSKKEPLYGAWCTMKTRCTNPNFPNYVHYGGRGITICDEWRHDFLAYRNYVTQLANYGKKGYTLDRIDNSLGYMPGNVRWATQSQQVRNSRKTRHLTLNGRTQCLTDWAIETKLLPNTIRSRLRMGWSVERTLTEPVKQSRKSG